MHPRTAKEYLQLRDWPTDITWSTLDSSLPEPHRALQDQFVDAQHALSP